MAAEQQAQADLLRRQEAEAADALRAREDEMKAREDEMRKVDTRLVDTRFCVGVVIGSGMG